MAAVTVVDTMDWRCNCPVCLELLTPRLNPLDRRSSDHFAGLDPRIDPLEMSTDDGCDCGMCLEIRRLRKEGKETAKHCPRYGACKACKSLRLPTFGGVNPVAGCLCHTCVNQRPTKSDKNNRNIILKPIKL
jgi:hypothetical protein